MYSSMLISTRSPLFVSTYSRSTCSLESYVYQIVTTIVVVVVVVVIIIIIITTRTPPTKDSGRSLSQLFLLLNVQLVLILYFKAAQ